MKVKSIPQSDTDIIQKFSEFLVEFNNTAEFIKYITTNNFRVEKSGLELFIPKKYHALIQENLEYFNRAFLNNSGPVDLMTEMDRFKNKLYSQKTYGITKEDIARLSNSFKTTEVTMANLTSKTNLFREKFPNLSSIAYQHLPLVNKKKEIRLIPLDGFIQMLNQRGRVVNKDSLL